MGRAVKPAAGTANLIYAMDALAGAAASFLKKRYSGKRGPEAMPGSGLTDGKDLFVSSFDEVFNKIIGDLIPLLFIG